MDFEIFLVAAETDLPHNTVAITVRGQGSSVGAEQSRGVVVGDIPAPDGLYVFHQPLCEILLLSEFYLVISKLERRGGAPVLF